jgi:DNA mismatch endonuclease (patch repair protein)
VFAPRDAEVSDIYSPTKRSAIMSRVRSRGNKDTELAVVRLLRKHKISGWRRNALVFGKPDFVFPATLVAVFIDGCFWHSCPRHRSTPVANRPFWSRKLRQNQSRDRLVSRTLRKNGWTVLRVWQHELTVRNTSKLIAKLRKASVSTR